jgi:hypothetical protein
MPVSPSGALVIDRVEQPIPDEKLDPYSVRSASRGLRRAARRAGSQHARSATPSRITVVAEKTAGSRGLTW